MKSFLSRCLLLWLALFWLSSAASAQYFQGGAPQVIWGKPLTDADLSGKVVYIEYWGIFCGPCRAAFPHLMECQSKYGSTGSFVLIGSHLQEMVPEVTDFLKQNNCNFTNFQGYTCPMAPPKGGGIPQAFLLNCRGELVAEGTPNEVLPKVEFHVKEALQRNRLVNGFNPILDLNVPSSQAKVAMKFTSDKAWAPLIKQMEKKASKDQEVQTFIDEINVAINTELQSLKDLLAERPSEAMYRTTAMMKCLKGMPQEEKAEKIIKKAKKMEGMDEMQKVWAQMQASRKKMQSGKMNPAAAGKEVAKNVKALKKIAENDSYDETLRQEAEILMKKMTGTEE
ncbi:MAG: TlpA family protein disulfide reductase [Thermoguttaceae bacterium]|nr:TlpA family protein disulfide reductase [Thermoguttaceae bacterium]